MPEKVIPELEGAVKYRDSEEFTPEDRQVLVVLSGIARATNANERITQEALGLLCPPEAKKHYGQYDPLEYWLDFIKPRADCPQAAVQMARMAVAIAYTQHYSRLGTSIPAKGLDRIWDIISAALLGPLFAGKRAARSHQGFLSVPLCDLRTADNENVELWRVHLWLPNRPMPDPEYLIHSHKSFAQGWILAGEGTNGDHTVEPAREDDATHAVFKLLDTHTITHEQVTSTVRNSKQFVKVSAPKFETHCRNMTYMVPVPAFHSSRVPALKAHATLFAFDAVRGYDDDGGVSLGPKDVQEVEQGRDPRGFKASTLARAINDVRTWEDDLERALASAKDGQWSATIELLENMGSAFAETHEKANASIDPTASEAAPGAQTMQEVENLVVYQAISNHMLSWARHGKEAVAHAFHGDRVMAQRAFALARQECNGMDSLVAERCRAIVSTAKG